MRRKGYSSYSQTTPWPLVTMAVAVTMLLSVVGSRTLPPPLPPPAPAPRIVVSKPVLAPKPPVSPCARDPGLPAGEATSLAGHLNYWHTCGTQIVDQNGKAVNVTGVAWAGMEVANGVPGGMDQRSYGAILETTKAMGYNVVRIPFSSAAIQPGFRPTGINPRLNPDLVGLSSLDVLDRVVEECGALGLKVILDRHRITPYYAPPLWFDASYSEDQWVADWVRLANHYNGNDTVVAMDLDNEPYGANWGTGDPHIDWRRAATRAGDAIVKANPRVLVFVEGIGTYGNRQTYWYGGELRGVMTSPIRLARPNRLVYSPHEYGPSVYPETWFSSPQFPGNLPAVWNDHWGFILQRGIAPVVVGEMGAPQVGYDAGGTWQRSFLSFMDQNHVGFLAWALNPGMSDTGSVFDPDWHTINGPRESLFAPYLRR